MTNLIHLALKNMRANRIRTTLTVLGVLVAIFIFCFFQSIQGAMRQIVDDAGEQNNVVVLEENVW